LVDAVVSILKGGGETPAGGLFVGEDARCEQVPKGDFFGVNPAQSLDAGLSFGRVPDDFHHKDSLGWGISFVKKVRTALLLKDWFFEKVNTSRSYLENGQSSHVGKL
jgi:hypothetical protein